MVRPLAWVATLLPALVLSSSAEAFDYLEHAYITDRACTLAQVRLAEAGLVSADPTVAARYLALSLFCPARWDKPYCHRGYKQLVGGLNRLDAPPDQSGDYAMTLGDYSALADHLSAFGPVRGLPQALEPGLLRRTLQWLSTQGDAGGVESDVAEDACETPHPLDWAAIDLSLPLNGPRAGPPPAWLQAPLRASPEKAAEDPSGAYSFDNPQYLDLVRRNHSHFNPASHETFVGFQATARRMQAEGCESLLALNPSDISDLADGLSPVPPTPCAAVAERVRQRLLQWSEAGDPARVAPVHRELTLLAGPQTPERTALLERVVPAFLALVFEGAGIHFLQDGFSGGHVRLVRTAENLIDSRYWHDFDGASGVMAYVSSEKSREVFLLYGDGFLLGHAAGSPAACDASVASVPRSPEQTTTCLLEAQRRRVLSASAAALLDWALPTPVIENGTVTADSEAPRRCDEGGAVAQYICAELPTSAPSVRPPASPNPLPRAGTLPIPPPPFSYQSFLVSTSLDAAGGPPELGIRTVFLSRLGQRANWMTSYHVGILTRLGSGPEAQVIGEFSYMFHWRWAARFLINLGPFAYFGLRDFTGAVTPFFGLGPNIGMSVLPEGWISLPLELTISYRAPLRLLDGQNGFRAVDGKRFEAHWIELSIGLAFMH